MDLKKVKAWKDGELKKDLEAVYGESAPGEEEKERACKIWRKGFVSGIEAVVTIMGGSIGDNVLDFGIEELPFG